MTTALLFSNLSVLSGTFKTICLAAFFHSIFSPYQTYGLEGISSKPWTTLLPGHFPWTTYPLSTILVAHP
ncbi:hypothetical protein VIGAN_08336800 [Vigna angularis var. angularis]|uniref:Uncharacterized protein n=1 Tax=Vigna angularis var. angularis TaxID=157739 RepID=A0A0S3SU96_PHAAN|nr:hypothetical protein VIGAN_08336800 [Vigna angularis var. angularis]